MKNEVINFLNTNRDEKNSSFSSKLIKDQSVILGVKLPILLKFAKAHVEDIEDILRIDDDNIFEIKMIKLFTISELKDVERYKAHFNYSVGLITNWSLCDSFIMHSKIIRKDKKYFFQKSKELINENDEFSKRIGFIILLGYYVSDDYVDEVFKIIKSSKTSGYYSEMALAWLVSVLYVKYPDKTKKYLSDSKIDKSILKMIIRKIKDSYRVSESDKDWLKKIEN